MPLAVLVLVCAIAAYGQARSFEVATVRRIVAVMPTASPGGPPPPPPPPVLRTTPTGLTLDGGTVLDCLSWAYGVPSFQIKAPDWIRANRYAISARTAGPVEPDRLKPLLVSLLEERFRIVVRRNRK